MRHEGNLPSGDAGSSIVSAGEPAAARPQRDLSTHPTSLLLDYWRAGDVAALEAVLCRYAPRIRAHVLARMGSFLRTREEVDDVCQLVYIECRQSLSGVVVTEENELMRFLSTCIEFRIRDRIDYHSAQRRVAPGRSVSIVAGTESSAGGHDIRDIGVGVGTSAATRELVEVLCLRIDTLPLAEKLVLILRDIDDLPWKDVAPRLEPPLSVKGAQKLHVRARAMLARRMLEFDPKLGSDGC